MATERLYERIETQVRDLINSGTLKPGDKAHSLRRMSQRNQISLSTVSQGIRVTRTCASRITNSRPNGGTNTTSHDTGIYPIFPTL
jgi:DNA-binding transcriptional MocR family regulator